MWGEVRGRCPLASASVQLLLDAAAAGSFDWSLASIGGGEGARLYTAMAAVTVMFSPHREINGTVLDHRLHAKAAERSLLVAARRKLQ